MTFSERCDATRRVNPSLFHTNPQPNPRYIDGATSCTNIYFGNGVIALNASRYIFLIPKPLPRELANSPGWKRRA